LPTVAALRESSADDVAFCAPLFHGNGTNSGKISPAGEDEGWGPRPLRAGTGTGGGTLPRSHDLVSPFCHVLDWHVVGVAKDAAGEIFINSCAAGPVTWTKLVLCVACFWRPRNLTRATANDIMLLHLGLRPLITRD
ncbi:hypothetical protein BHM03_00053014, partial [Ensete ventricosum]